MSTNFVSYANATALMTSIGQKFEALKGAYVIKGNVAFANLPETPTEAQTGYVYNITNNFTTDARFVEGSGKKYPAGTNVVVVDLSTYDAVTPAGSENPSTEGWYEIVDGKYVLSADTEVDNEKTYYAKTVSVKYDIFGSFVDVDAIMQAIADVSAMIASEFDKSQAYAIGDLTTYQGDLYCFVAAHTANDDWDDNEVSAATVDSLLDAVNIRISTLDSRVTNVRTMICDDVFDAANAYSIGDIVTKDDVLYKFKAAHTAGDPWSALEVDAVSAVDLIDAAEPAELTTAQVNALLALL